MRLFFALPLALAIVAFSAGVGLSQGFSPTDAPRRMVLPDGIAVNLVASEPDIRQPIVVTCDDRGRVWTVQYLQYPNPAGLKRVKVDRFSRTVYDRVPEPPPNGPRGEDKITICEDTDGDGRADRFKDFVTGLNLCTGVAFGHGGVYVLQVPYLLFYPERNGDDVPDTDPEVLLSGFGMDDAQSLASHLTWGPDGWLYGVTGSTSGNNVRGVEFQQSVWRYEPRSKRFELFCEGGGNLFGLTFDADGNLFFASNGNDLAYHAVQGGYYRKNFGKHGPLHNPYAYGYFEQLLYDQPVAGPRPGGTIYVGDALPEPFRGTYLCCEFLQHSAAWWRLDRRGSTFKATYGGTLLDSRDTWFCAPDLCQGADGAVYICDFYDERTAHPDPDAKWDRSNGRIYRIAANGTKPVKGLDIGRKTGAELVELLRHPNGWYAERARAQLAARRDPGTWPALSALARTKDEPRRALQGLWGLHVSGGFDDIMATELLGHPGEYVRAWVIRLLGDRQTLSPVLASRLADLAEADTSVVVRAQLAASARRLPAAEGVSIVERLVRRGLDRDDPYIPLLLWWSVEPKALANVDRLDKFFGDRQAWEDLGRRELAILLLRRYAAEGSEIGYDAAARLLSTVPAKHKNNALAAIELGLAGRGATLGGMGTAGLFGAVAVPERNATIAARPSKPLTTRLARAVEAAWREQTGDLVRLRLAVRAGAPGAVSSLVAQTGDPEATTERRLSLLSTLAELGGPESLPVALALFQNESTREIQRAALDVIARVGGNQATEALLDRYMSVDPAMRSRIREVLLGRPDSARAFLRKIESGEFAAADVPVEQLRLVAVHGNPTLDALVRKHWGNIQPGTPEEKLAEMRRLTNDLRAGTADSARGKTVFRTHCTPCHKMNGEGGEVGPDLTGVARNDTASLLASIVDPGAVIRLPYLQYAAVTSGGRIVTGIVVSQDEAGVVFVDAKGNQSRLPRKEIDEIRPLPNSIMPDDLLKNLKPQEVRDLFAYLRNSER